MNVIETPSIKKNYFYSTIYEILCVILPFITMKYTATVLEPTGNGIYSYTEAIKSYFALFAALGTASYGKREIARNRDNIYERSKLFWEIEILSIVTSSITIVFWLIFIFFTTEYKIIYLIFTISLFSTMLNINWFFAGMEQFKYTVTKNIFVKLIGLICLFTFVKTKEDLYIYIFLHCIIDFLGNLSMWISIKKFIQKVNLHDLQIFRHLKETFVYFIPAISTSIYTLLDKILLQVILKDEAQSGFYKKANDVIKMIKTITFSSINSLLESRISFLFKQEKYEEIHERIDKSINFIFFMTIGSCFGLIGVSDSFVKCFLGDGYEPTIQILRLMSPTLIIIGISNCIGSHYYNPAGFRGKSAVFIIIGSITNLICNFIFIPYYKAEGAVIGTLIAESVITILYIIFSKRYFTISLLFKASYKKIISATFMLLGIRILPFFISNNVLLLILQLITGSTIYILSLLLLKDKFVKEFLFAKVKKMIKKITGN